MFRRDSEILKLMMIKLDVVVQAITIIMELEAKMSAEMDRLEAEVAETGTVVDSVIVLLQGIAQQLQDAGTDRAKLDQLASDLDAKTNALAEAAATVPPQPTP